MWAHLVAFIVVTIGLVSSSVLVDIGSRSGDGVVVWTTRIVVGVLAYAISVLVATYFREILDFLTALVARLPRSLLRRRYLRRPLPLAVGGVVVILILLVSQAIAPVISRGIASAAAASDLEPGPLRILSAFDESPRDPRRILIDQWNRIHPDNQVYVVDVAEEPDGQFDSFVTRAEQGAASDIDVYVLDNVWVPRFVRDRYIRPLDRSRGNLDEAAFLEETLRYCRALPDSGDQLWCLPLNADAGLLYHQTNISGFDPPRGWDDCMGDPAREVMAAIEADPERRAYAPNLIAASAAQLSDEESRTVTAFEAIWAAGGIVVNGDGAPVLSSDGQEVVFDPQAMRGLAALADAYRDRAITLPTADRADEAAAVDAFRDGQVLCMRNWPVAYDNVDPSNSGQISFAVGNLGYPSVLGGQNLAIASSTPQPRAAQALIEFLTSSASQLILFEVGSFAPARRDIYDLPASRLRPYMDALRRSLVEARPRPITACYTEFSRKFREGIDDALRDEGALEPGFPRELAATLNCEPP